MKLMKTVGISGCGNMGEVIVDAAVSVVGAKNVYCYDVDSVKLSRIKKIYQVNLVRSNVDVVEKSDVFIIAVKPQQMKDVLNEVKHVVNKNKVIVSIAAGVKIKTLNNLLGDNIQVVRVMPNLPLKIGYGVVAVCKNKFCKEKNFEFVKKLFEKKGIVVEVTEKFMDLITAVSGSGPAYIFYISEILQNVAKKLRLPKKIVPLVVNYTILGAANMLVKQNVPAVKLKEAVTSKGGTTEQALKVFYENNLEKIFLKAISKAFKRAKELSKLVS